MINATRNLLRNHRRVSQLRNSMIPTGFYSEKYLLKILPRFFQEFLPGFSKYFIQDPSENFFWDFARNSWKDPPAVPLLFPPAVPVEKSTRNFLFVSSRYPFCDYSRSFSYDASKRSIWDSSF